MWTSTVTHLSLTLIWNQATFELFRHDYDGDDVDGIDCIEVVRFYSSYTTSKSTPNKLRFWSGLVNSELEYD